MKLFQHSSIQASMRWLVTGSPAAREHAKSWGGGLPLSVPGGRLNEMDRHSGRGDRAWPHEGARARADRTGGHDHASEPGLEQRACNCVGVGSSTVARRTGATSWDILLLRYQPTLLHALVHAAQVAAEPSSDLKLACHVRNAAELLEPRARRGPCPLPGSKQDQPGRRDRDSTIMSPREIQETLPMRQFAMHRTVHIG